MWATVILSIMLAVCVMALPGTSGTNDPRGVGHPQAEATNFKMYRGSVNNYVKDFPSFTGAVTDASIADEMGPWKKGGWQNLVTASSAYVHGPLSHEAGLEVISLVGPSAKLGWKKSGRLVSPFNGDMGPLPASIAEGRFVSLLDK